MSQNLNVSQISEKSFTSSMNQTQTNKELRDLSNFVIEFGSRLIKYGFSGSINLLSSYDNIYSIHSRDIDSYLTHKEEINYIRPRVKHAKNAAYEFLEDYFRAKYKKYPPQRNKRVWLSFSDSMFDQDFIYSTVQILIEKFDFENVYILKKEVLSYYLFRLNHCLIVNIGSIQTNVLPIIDNVPLYKFEKVINIGSNDINYELAVVLKEDNPTLFKTASEVIDLLSFDLLSELAWRLFLFEEKDSKNAINLESKIELGNQIIKLISLRLVQFKSKIKMAENQILKIKISNKSRIKIANSILEISPTKNRNIPRIIDEYLNNLIPDIQFKLRQSVLLSGGIFCFPDFSKKIIEEFNYYHMDIVPSHLNPLYLDFMGLAVISALEHEQLDNVYLRVSREMWNRSKNLQGKDIQIRDDNANDENQTKNIPIMDNSSFDSKYIWIAKINEYSNKGKFEQEMKKNNAEEEVTYGIDVEYQTDDYLHDMVMGID